jgi:uncharacterized protein
MNKTVTLPINPWYPSRDAHPEQALKMMHSAPTDIHSAIAIPALDDLQGWQMVLEEIVSSAMDGDGSHDIGHIRRVYRNAVAIDAGSKASEKCHPLVLLVSSYLHDIVNLPKNHPDRHLTSRLCAEKAVNTMARYGLGTEMLNEIAHAIEAHSFSAGITPRTQEARVLQDADRLDALGAIGIARCFYVNGRMGTQLFDEDDPLAEKRDLDDKSFALDHFEVKLLKLPEMMNTPTGRKLAHQRAKRIKRFRSQIIAEMEMSILPMAPEDR